MHTKDDLFEALSSGKKVSRPGDGDAPLNVRHNPKNEEESVPVHSLEQAETGLDRICD